MPRSMAEDCSWELARVAEGARFENASGPETIGRYLAQSVSSQSLTEESEAEEEPVKTDRMR